MFEVSMRDKYEEYEQLYSKSNKKFNMHEKLDYNTFAQRYRQLQEEQSIPLEVREGGNANIIHGKLTKYIVESQVLGGYEDAKAAYNEWKLLDKEDRPEGWESDDLTQKDFLRPDLSKWEGSWVEGVNKKTGRTYRYQMTKTNAYFIWASQMGIKDVAEAQYGY